MALELRDFRVHVPEADLDDLRTRLLRTRWPEPSPVPDWRQGIPLEVVQELCRYWLEDYDWRATEARLNAWPQYLVDVDGLDIHVLHARSPHAGALPLVLTHGWPGSVLELLPLVGPLTDPVAHGGTPHAAFDVVIPSLPGYGFSGRPSSPGWGIERIARCWQQVMSALGYDRYAAAGSDWGTSISSVLGQLDREHVVGIHLVPPIAGPDPSWTPTPDEQRALDDLFRRGREASAYGEQHRTAPQTVGYALLDSPAGLLAWMGEKLLGWTGPTTPLTPDQVLDQVTLYWLTGTAASSARLYAESIEQVSRWIGGEVDQPVEVPVGASVFAGELPRPSRRWAQRRYPDIRYWAEHDTGGHFPALEVPELLVADLRESSRGLR